MPVERIKPDGTEDHCEMKDIKKGEWFRALGESRSGPYFEAAADADLRPDPREPQKAIWGIKIKGIAVQH